MRAEIREWIDNEILPNVGDWDEARKVPDEIYKAMGTKGYLAGLMGTHYPKEYTDNKVASVAPEQWDLFHELLLTDELSRAASGGFVWNVIGGFGIGCPPVIKFGKDALKKRILPGILNGDKRICLAITEPDAGSDVANLTCEAKLTEDGKHYIVNGEKKWITNGVWSDYFTTAVRTGTKESGMNGVSVLLIERSMGGVSTRKMDCQGVWSSGTTYITFEDVKVPVENLIGKENQGFKGKLTRSQMCPGRLLTNYSHHDQLQPRENRHHHPVSSLLSRLLRRISQICPQASHIWQEAHRPSCHTHEARPYGASDRGIVLMARVLDGTAQAHARAACSPTSRWPDRCIEGPEHGDL